MSDSLFTRRLSLWFIIFLGLCGTVFYLYKVFYYNPPLTHVNVKPDIEIHFNGPPLQEKGK